MKKPGMTVIDIEMGPSKKKGGSILGVPGKEPMEDDDMGGDSEKKTLGKQFLRAYESKDPIAVFEAISEIVSCCGDSEPEEEME